MCRDTGSGIEIITELTNVNFVLRSLAELLSGHTSDHCLERLRISSQNAVNSSNFRTNGKDAHR